MHIRGKVGNATKLFALFYLDCPAKPPSVLKDALLITGAFDTTLAITS